MNKNICKDVNLFKFIKRFKKNNIDDLVYYHDEKRIGNNIYNLLGSFYIMDSSSCFLSYYLKDLVKENGIVFDMCSAPGGKSISLSIRMIYLTS